MKGLRFASTNRKQGVWGAKNRSIRYRSQRWFVWTKQVAWRIFKLATLEFTRTLNRKNQDWTKFGSDLVTHDAWREYAPFLILESFKQHLVVEGMLFLARVLKKIYLGLGYYYMLTPFHRDLSRLLDNCWHLHSGNSTKATVFLKLLSNKRNFK